MPKPHLPGVIALYLLIALPCQASMTDTAAFEMFLASYLNSPRELRADLVSTFVRTQSSRGGFPIADGDGQVVFVWWGDDTTRDVRLLGDFARLSAVTFAWDTDGLPMQREGDIFHLRLNLEPDARLDYAFLVDGERRVDPLNADTIVSGPGAGDASVLSMPAYRFSRWAEPRADVARGTVETIAASWANPEVHVYLPPGYDPARRYSTLYTPDAQAWIDAIRLPTILDNLIADSVIDPIIAVMIDAPPDRDAWHLFNPDYLAHLRRVVEHVDARHATRARPDARVHAGTSSGARAALFVGLEAPDLIANLALLSPSLTAPVHHLEPWFSGRRAPAGGLRVWMSAGTYEGYVIKDAHIMHAWFERHGLSSTTVYLHQGHSFGAWREAAARMLEFYFPPGLDEDVDEPDPTVGDTMPDTADSGSDPEPTPEPRPEAEVDAEDEAGQELGDDEEAETENESRLGTEIEVTPDQEPPPDIATDATGQPGEASTIVALRHPRRQRP